MGRYVSDEIDSTYEIALGPPLVLKRKKYAPAELIGAGGDDLRIADFSQGVSGALTAVNLHFNRDAQNKITDFTMDDGNSPPRIKNFRFTRLP